MKACSASRFGLECRCAAYEDGGWGGRWSTWDHSAGSNHVAAGLDP